MSAQIFDSVDEYYAIEVAIKNGDLAYARELLRLAHLAAPSAETFYLSAQVATTTSQRITLLQGALSLKPDHAKAALALEQAQREAEKAPAEVKSTFSLARISQAIFARLS